MAGEKGGAAESVWVVVLWERAASASERVVGVRPEGVVAPGRVVVGRRSEVGFWDIFVDLGWFLLLLGRVEVWSVGWLVGWRLESGVRLLGLKLGVTLVGSQAQGIHG